MSVFNQTYRNKRLEGKTVVITGASSGIGKETARDLYARGARVILACRNVKKTNEAIENIRKDPPSWMTKHEYENNAGELAIYSLDLSNLESVKKCAKELLRKEKTINILINNAGLAESHHIKTKDGHETTFQVNYLGHYLLTLLLLPKIQLSAPDCRIINVSSLLYFLGDIHFDNINMENCYGSIKSYAQSKLGNILFTKELARRMKKANIHGVTVYSLHPGIIATNISENIRDADQLLYFCFNWCARMFGKSLAQGAETTIYCAIEESISNDSGLFYSNCGVAHTYRKANNQEYAEKLWNLSCRLLSLDENEDFADFLKNVSRQML